MTTTPPTHTAPLQKLPPDPRPRVVVFLLTLALVLVGGVAGGLIMQKHASDTAAPTTWVSGAFLSEHTTLSNAVEYGRWRNRAPEALVIYAAHETWADLTGGEGLMITLAGYDGTLVFSLPPLPSEKDATLADVAAGKYDVTYQTVADQLAKHGFGNAIVRVGWEANLDWSPWSATAANASQYQAAVHHVMGVLKARVPSLRTEWDLACGRGLDGGRSRTAALEDLYPGDDVTDIVGCDHYDSYAVRAMTPEGWQNALRPPNGVGLDDVADFARAHGKGLGVPEWGLSNEQFGGGDNPGFIRHMYDYFEANRDILAVEAYFDEPSEPTRAALWGGPDGTINPRAAEVYRDLF